MYKSTRTTFSNVIETDRFRWSHMFKGFNNIRSEIRDKDSNSENNKIIGKTPRYGLLYCDMMTDGQPLLGNDSINTYPRQRVRV
jgi:hypothetical protein